MLWEISVSSTHRETHGVWSPAELKLLLEAVGSALQIYEDPEERLGKGTSGACLALHVVLYKEAWYILDEAIVF